MRCISCEMEIDPKWKHAIDINICPFCGQGIMDEVLRDLISVLRETMESLQKYPDQLNDWLLSNHSYIKTDSPQLPNFLPKEYVHSKNRKSNEDAESKKYTVKVMTEAGEQDVVAEKVQTEEKTNEFFKRAEAIKPNIDGFKSTEEKTAHLKKLKKQIERDGSPVLNASGAAQALISPEQMESADPEAVAEFQSLISGGENIASSLSDNNSDDDIPSVVLNMAARAKGSNSSNAADLQKLQKQQDKIAEARRNMSSGAKGSFSRS